ncbi:MAG TPA: Sec-independent protein translocase protein TatB [Steroidobacteraceae bacterium]
MFEVGFTEIILILGLALLVLGPEKLPGLAQKVGYWTGRARAMARQLRTQLEHEVTMEELMRSRSTQPPPHKEPQPQSPDVSSSTVDEPARQDGETSASSAEPQQASSDEPLSTKSAQ